MKLLFIGYSDIVQRRVLPAALSVAAISEVVIASRSRSTQVVLPEGETGKVFADYDQALAESGAEIVYISTVNSDHARWAEAALHHGLHVVVDKPAFATVAETERLLTLAKRQKRCLAEANVYAYHPQINQIQTLFADANTVPKRIMAIFSFPPLPADNFRYRRDLMGGALWDLGPYAITPGRIFFGETPLGLTCHITAWGDDVETAFSMVAWYSNGRSLVGHFGFDTGYCNQLKLLGPDRVVAVERAFTTPPHVENHIHVKHGYEQYNMTVPAADTFACFLTAVTGAVMNNQFATFGQTMLADAYALAQLRESGYMTKNNKGDNTRHGVPTNK